MARTWTAQAGEGINLALGNLGSITGALTLAALVKHSEVTGAAHVVLLAGTSSGATRWNLHIGGADGKTPNCRLGNTLISAPTIKVQASDGWALFGITKASGTTTPRWFKYTVATDTWTLESHGSAVASPSAATTGAYIGRDGAGGGSEFKGDIAWVAAFTQACTDDQIKSMIVNLAGLWQGLAGLWVLDQDSTSQRVRDLTGGGADETSHTATTVSTSSVPAWSWGAQPIIADAAAPIRDAAASLALTTSLAAAAARTADATAGLALQATQAAAATRTAEATSLLALTLATSLAATAERQAASSTPLTITIAATASRQADTSSLLTLSLALTTSGDRQATAAGLLPLTTSPAAAAGRVAETTTTLAYLLTITAAAIRDTYTLGGLPLTTGLASSATAERDATAAISLLAALAATVAANPAALAAATIARVTAAQATISKLNAAAAATASPPTATASDAQPHATISRDQQAASTITRVAS